MRNEYLIKCPLFKEYEIFQAGHGIAADHQSMERTVLQVPQEPGQGGFFDTRPGTRASTMSRHKAIINLRAIMPFLGNKSPKPETWDDNADFLFLLAWRMVSARLPTTDGGYGKGCPIGSLPSLPSFILTLFNVWLYSKQKRKAITQFVYSELIL